MGGSSAVMAQCRQRLRQPLLLPLCRCHRIGLPFFLAVVIFMQIVMLIFSVHRAWVPLLGLCGCILSIRDYVPINVPSAPPKGAMKVISYNVNCFSANTKDETGTNVICAYVKRQRPDILCMQEAHAWPTIYETDVEPVLRQQLAYADTMNFASSTLACFSRYPIIGKSVSATRDRPMVRRISPFYSRRMIRSMSSIAI